MPPRTNSQNPKPKTSRRFIVGWLLFGLLAALVILTEHQAVYDWLRLRGYKPPADIAAIANDDELTPAAERVFYVNHPLVQDKSDFAKSCPNGNKETAVLGCYVPDQRGIYVLNVTDSRLAGIEQVTGAHELLHAEYDRLTAGDKQEVDSMLMDYYHHGLMDETIKKQLDSYKKTEPNDLVNEMHSIFGTEVGGLPAPLEDYYKRYFADRSKITGYYNTYEAEFTTRQLQIQQDDAQLKAWKAQIASLEADLKIKQAALQAQQSQLNAARSRGDLNAYNTGVPAYNSAVNAYNAEVRQLRDLINKYNALVAARNAIVLEEQQLTQDISSGVSPIGKQ